MFSEFNPISSATKILLNGSLGYAITYGSENIAPLNGALFCALSCLVSQVAGPAIKQTFNKEGTHFITKCIGWGASAFCSVEIPREVLRIQEIHLSHEACASMAITSGFIVALVYGLSTSILSCKYPSHRLTSDPFLEVSPPRVRN